MYKLIIFDLDGTLVKKWTDELLPGVEEFFSKCKSAVAIATNQGRVGLRYWMEQDGFGEPDKFPTEEQVWERLRNVQAQLPTFVPYVSWAYQSKKGAWGPQKVEHDPFAGHNEIADGWRKDWRKPDPGMLLQAMAFACATPAETLMVGDMESDRLAAEAAGCAFAWADEFFGRTPRVQPDAASQRDDGSRGG